MNTKQRIVETALQLFNKNGTDSITTRHIAAAMNISHGNLCYHFRNKEEIIKKLYEALVAELDQVFEPGNKGDLSMRGFDLLLRTTFKIQLKYKFFLMEMVKIMRAIPEIMVDFKKLYQKREQQITFFVDAMIFQGYFIKEQLQRSYTPFIKLFYIIGDFWISEAEILFDGSEEEKLETYYQLARAYFIPYLTEKGLASFNGTEE